MSESEFDTSQWKLHVLFSKSNFFRYYCFRGKVEVPTPYLTVNSLVIDISLSQLNALVNFLLLDYISSNKIIAAQCEIINFKTRLRASACKLQQFMYST